MKMNNRFYLLILAACTIIAGCNNNDDKKTDTTPVVVKKPAIMQPFRFHKLIEVSPGNDFDVLSWGRGSQAVGSFLILHSDSSGMKYNTTTGDLDGSIVDVYNSDMDLDGNPEILIQAKATDTTNYAVIYAFEFNNSKANKLDFPKLTSSQRKGYRGNDNFYIKEGKFMREFPIYDGDGKNAKPTGAKRLLQYGLRNNEFTVQQVSKDSTLKSTTKTTATPTAKATSTEKKKSSSTSNQSSTSSSKKKKKKSDDNSSTTTHKKKKKKHHHSSDDN
ncbi:hypothetical protein SAMN05216490_1812 [Mucilaginibacter mallensis]|uniref:FG-GAP repeat-containing protein n=2 Tax=Mucilaginibacter mallensis TaxID=652787 RepID=A0A1H1V283_MUCMA|nr:hypothetical protein SAMN05216490_1812 [Mucilaginibacter mallensis]